MYYILNWLGEKIQNSLPLCLCPWVFFNIFHINYFLFVLVVGRLIKYTGYGNAAGMLSNRGLMLGGRSNTVYSSDSEDSDTEEYLKYKDK